MALHRTQQTKVKTEILFETKVNSKDKVTTKYGLQLKF